MADQILRETPKKILLATDLSPRADRAHDRATALAAQWHSELVVLHVLEDFAAEPGDDAGPIPSWRRPPDPTAYVWKQFLSGLSSIENRTTVLVGKGDPAEIILQTAEAERCDLIVIGTARDELLGRFRLGRTVDRLLRRADVPVLVVKNRARRPYQHVVAATDFTEASRQAIEAATRLFPEHTLTIFHAYDAPLSGVLNDPASYQRDYRQVAQRDYDAFMGTVALPAGGPKPKAVIEHGIPDVLLREYVLARDVDLIVLGTRGRHALLEVILSSTAKSIMDNVHSDTLVIREAKGPVADAGP